MVYLFAGLLTGGVLTAICWPLFARENRAESAILEETEWDLLQRKKDVVLGNIQDLDFEYKCGKLSAADYQKSRSELTAEVASVYREIDRIESEQDLDALIRTQVAARKQKPRKKKTLDTSACSTCRHPNSPGNKFCSECGARLP